MLTLYWQYLSNFGTNFHSMLFADTYKSLQGQGESVYRDRGSRFIGLAFPMRTEAEAKAQIEKIRKTYHDATHHCYAYLIGYDKSCSRISDDGEPSGTAGRPIMGQMLSSDVTNLLVIVVRYYGGKKLGVAGLIEAYRTCALQAIQQAGIQEHKIMELYRLEFEYGLMNDVMKTLKEEVDIRYSDFGMKCVIEAALAKNRSEVVLHQWNRIKDLKFKFIEII